MARLLGHAVIEKRIPPLWESRAVDYPLAREVLDHATGARRRTRATSATACARDGLPQAGSHVVPHAAWPAPADRSRPPSPAIAADRRLREPQREQARAPAARGVRARPAAPSAGARLLLVGAPSPGFDLERRLQRLGLDGDGVERPGTSTRRGCGR